MGFRGLISADGVAASYENRKLVLYAEGTVQEATYGIKFEQVPWVGGLKFTLEGWTGPLLGKDRHYKHKQAIDIQLPNRVYPSNTVIIVTANHLNGEVVPIHWLGLKEQPPKDDITSKDPTPSELQLLPSNDIQLNELFKLPFIIKQAAGVPKGGSVHIKFDPTYLTLTGSGIQDADINWTFNSLQTGNTQVIVTVFGGIAKFVFEVVYNVRIFVLSPFRSGFPEAFNNVPGKGAKEEEEILSFLGRVNIAVRKVQGEYPDAQLYVVDATPNYPESVENPNELAHLKLTFNAKKDGKQGTATIESVGWSEFSDVRFVPIPIFGDAAIPWPSKYIELTEADAIIKEHGYTLPYDSAVFSQALTPEVKEPYYTFSFVDGSSISVGAKDGKIPPKDSK